MKKILLALLALSILALPSLAWADIAPEPDVFTDVKDGNEAYWEIAWLKEEGIINGYADGSFNPDATVNRAEFAKIVSIAAWNHDPSTDTLGGALPFSDVAETAWYEPYVHKLFTQNVISGYDDGTFRPETTINFAESAKVLSNSYSCFVLTEGYDTWWEPYSTKLLELEIVPDSIQEDKSPWYDKSITRGEMAIMIYNMEHAMDDSGACPQ